MVWVEEYTPGVRIPALSAYSIPQILREHRHALCPVQSGCEDRHRGPSSRRFLSAYEYVRALVAQSCPTLCDPMDYTCRAPLSMGFPRILEWLALSFSRGSS